MAGDPRAVAEFCTTVRAELPRWLGRLPVEHDEVLQLLALRLGIGTDPDGRLRRYDATKSFYGWVRVVAVRLATNLVHERTQVGDPISEVADSPTDPSHVRQFAGPFQACLEAAFQALPPRSQTVLLWHYRYQVDLERVARAFDVHRVTVSRWIAEARTMLEEATRERLMAAEGLTADEAQSILRSLEPAVGGALLWSELVGHVSAGPPQKAE
jgi:RNA polymerase sigma-70 factor (ECF subfamily)